MPRLTKFNFMAELHHEDIVAMFLIAVFGVLKLKGVETGLDDVIILVGGFYFGTATQKRAENLK